MSVQITLSNLSWSTPDQTPLFTDLTLGFGPERTGLVGRNGCGKTTLLRLIAGDISPSSGSVSVSGRLAVMQQEARGAETVADLFGVSGALALLDRAEAGTASLDDLAEADWTLPARLEAALQRLGLAVDPQAPLARLSGGQRTRAALAAMVFTDPDILLLDEPTNNLDHDGRQAVRALLRGWRGGAVVVSHDRDLLEEMDAIVELSGQGATRYGGGYSAYRQQKELELDAARRDLAEAEKARTETARRAQQAAERKARSDSRGRKARAGGGQAKVLLDAAKERSQASGGANARLREGLQAKAEEALATARDRIERLDPLHMDLPEVIVPKGRTVLRLDDVVGGPDPEAPVIRGLSLTVTGPERLAVTGTNGSGKTSLLRLIAGQVAPLSGTVTLSVKAAFLDQHVSLLAPDLNLRDNFRRLDPEAGDTQIRAALARFRFRADAALKPAGVLSGGERLRAGLACTLGQARPPELLILDEPTNHLDLDAIEALEAALNGYGGAMIVVSHDARFLDRIGVTRWLAL